MQQSINQSIKQSINQANNVSIIMNVVYQLSIYDLHLTFDEAPLAHVMIARDVVSFFFQMLSPFNISFLYNPSPVSFLNVILLYWVVQNKPYFVVFKYRGITDMSLVHVAMSSIIPVFFIDIKLLEIFRLQRLQKWRHFFLQCHTRFSTRSKQEFSKEKKQNS